MVSTTGCSYEKGSGLYIAKRGGQIKHPTFLIYRFKMGEAPSDSFRILIATDNHLGFAERDPVRGKCTSSTEVQ